MSKYQLKPMSTAPKPNKDEYSKLLVLDEWLEMGEPVRGWAFVYWLDAFDGAPGGWYGDSAADLRNPVGWILSTHELPTIDAEPERLHWFSFAFDFHSNSSSGAANTYLGFPDKLITLARIEKAKRSLSIEDINACVLLCATYLGYMTREELDG